MPTPIKNDTRTLQESIQAIIKREINYIQTSQKKNKGMTPENRRQLKTLSDVLADQNKLQQRLDEDLNRFLEGLPERIVEAIAEHRKNPAASAKKAPDPEPKQAKGDADASKEPGSEVGSEAEARGTGAD